MWGGGNFYANKGSKVYQCYAHSIHNKDKERCNNKESISINVLDTVLWKEAKHYEIRFLGKEATEDKIKYLEAIEILKLKIKNAEKQLKKEDLNIEKIADNYVSGLYTKEKRDIKIVEIKTLITSINNNIANWKTEINHLNELVNIINNKINNEELKRQNNNINFIKQKINSAEQEALHSVQFSKLVNEITNVKDMYEIVHRHISNIQIENAKCNGREAKKITIIPYNGIVTTYYSLCKIGKQSPTSKPKTRIYREEIDGTLQPIDINIMQRIITEKRM